MSTLADTIAATLAEHGGTLGRAEQIHPSDGPNCGWAVVRHCFCGEWSMPLQADRSDVAAHRAHVADILAADFTARLNAERARNGQVPPEGWVS